jgi:hypothetical protein
MGKYLKLVSQHIGTALRLESLTPAGRLNFSLVALALAIVVATGALDLAQAVIRAWKPHYESGLPSTLTFFEVWLVAMLLCILIIAGAQRRDD